MTEYRGMHVKYLPRQWFYLACLSDPALRDQQFTNLSALPTGYRLKLVSASALVLLYVFCNLSQGSVSVRARRRDARAHVIGFCN